MLQRKQRKNRTEVTFVLPVDDPPGPVSVVGDFNDWQPGAHPLTTREDGTRTVTLALPGNQSHSFRYLAAGDYWFDEEQADGHDGRNSRLHT
ncbi:isoamylase early set domain-containing protein [Streptomyces erythrochromogenes]|uniref:isoamylase early set domain-containing protein n=1 Tax=Streptomyces erythrochromogenes TaxID=285574 RepID=UPI0037FAF3F1